jgi:hypothetical protein
MASISGLYGGSVSKVSGDRKWQPSIWVDATFRAIGIFHVGGYMQFLGEDFPLDDPSVGGGVALALRGDIRSVRLGGGFNTGYMKVPVGANLQGREGAWNISAYGMIGYAFLKWMSFDVRARWIRYFSMDTAGAPDHAWVPEGGLSFFIP